MSDFAFAQRATEFGLTTITFLLRTNVDAQRVAVAIFSRGGCSKPSVSDNTTMAEVVADELWRERLTAELTGISRSSRGLAAIGLYAIVAYSVTRRTREFARVALARRKRVAATGADRSLRPVLAGSTIGLLVALASSRLIQTLLFEASAIDPLALVGAVSVLLVVAASAAWGISSREPALIQSPLCGGNSYLLGLTA
jgi:hypothetical protein